MKIKIICLSLLAILLITPLFINANSENSEYTFTNEEKTITVSGNNLSEEKALLLSNNIMGNSNIIITPYNLLCIFGHSIETGIIIETAHHVYSTNPYCHFSAYDIKYCTRSNCDYTSYTLSDSFRIACCY